MAGSKNVLRSGGRPVASKRNSKPSKEGKSGELSTQFSAALQDDVQDKTLADRAYRWLRRDIITGVQNSGEQLNLERLREHYSIGLAPLREALQRLSAEGLVIVEGQRGFRINHLSVEEMWDLANARKVVESGVLQLSIPFGDDRWEAAIVGAAYRLEKYDRMLAAGDGSVMEKWEECNREFHDAIVSVCSSKWLLRVRNLLYDQFSRYRYAAINDSLDKRDVLAEHIAIRDAVIARDVELAAKHTCEHIDRTAGDFAKFLKVRSESTAGFRTCRSRARP